MKIIHFISGIGSGGVEQMLINYTGILNKNTDFTQIVVFQHDPDKICLNKLERAGDKCVRISDKRHHPLKNLWQSYRIIKSEQPDIVHCHMSLLNFFPLFIAWICHVKVRISHSHISSSSNPRFVDWIFKRLNIIFATKLLACGEDAGHFLYGKSKFKVIRNAINIDNFINIRKKNQDERRELHIPSDAVVIGHIGRFVDQKNHGRLLDIFFDYYWNLNRKAYLLLVGDGDLKKEMEIKADNLGIKNRVLFTGNVDNVSKYYSVMDVFLLPSLYEGLPIVAIEAQCSGIPMLISNTIDSDAKILSTTKLLSLNLSNLKWEKNLDRLVHERKIDFSTIKDILVQKGFSIEKEVENLNGFYKQAVEEI
ncbi:glycosyl transferase family 1 [Levilactobacillus zymae]|uniref:Glycosyl transferase family 1 n=1 Tax=Levilactobacillus zymae TaxID=267363 RepID=A0ABQ0WXA1_9LACO|nr:glycosyltransferase [Levilactobacillus zymae]GEO72158.1 glycosyl transferase family 1 [Levilactobacillus zymae]